MTHGWRETKHALNYHCGKSYYLHQAFPSLTEPFLKKNQHRYSMECDGRNVRRLLPAVTSQEKFYESSSQKEGRARSAHGANRISCQSPTCSNSKFLTEGGGGSEGGRGTSSDSSLPRHAAIPASGRHLDVGGSG